MVGPVHLDVLLQVIGVASISSGSRVFPPPARTACLVRRVSSSTTHLIATSNSSPDLGRPATSSASVLLCERSSRLCGFPPTLVAIANTRRDKKPYNCCFQGPVIVSGEAPGDIFGRVRVPRFLRRTSASLRCGSLLAQRSLPTFVAQR